MASGILPNLKGGLKSETVDRKLPRNALKGEHSPLASSRIGLLDLEVGGAASGLEATNKYWGMRSGSTRTETEG
jgi:hypothetical protein